MQLSLSINTTELQLFVDHSMFILYDLWIFVCATHLHMLWGTHSYTSVFVESILVKCFSMIFVRLQAMLLFK